MRPTKAHQLDLPLGFRQQQAVGRAYLSLEGTLVPYTIKRSLRRRAISILVDEDGVRVGAPWTTTHNAIERLLRLHSAWVLKKLKEWQMRRAPAHRWADGESLMLLGMRFTLRVAPTGGPPQLRGEELCVSTAGDKPVARQVYEWMHTQALECFTERVEHYRRHLGIPRAPQVVLSSARTRWGSCHASGRIHLNWRLIQMPAHLLDYVVAHEVAHLLEMNHSQHFWSLVGTLVPGYAACRKELRHEAHQYLLV